MYTRKLDIVVCPNCGIPLFFRASVDFSKVEKVQCFMCHRWVSYCRHLENDNMLVATRGGPVDENKYEELQEEMLAHPEEYKQPVYRSSKEWPSYWKFQDTDEDKKQEVSNDHP